MARPFEYDQAEGLRRLFPAAGTRTLAVTGPIDSAAGLVSALLGAALIQQHRKALLITPYSGLGYLPDTLGLKTDAACAFDSTASQHKKSLLTCLTEWADLSILPLGLSPSQPFSGQRALALADEFAKLATQLDHIVLDASLHAETGNPLLHIPCDDILLVARDTPASLTGSYALIKRLRQDGQVGSIRFLLQTQNSDTQIATHLFEQLAQTTRRFLGYVPIFLGVFPEEPEWKRALKMGLSPLSVCENSKATEILLKIAEGLPHWPRSAQQPVNGAQLLHALIR